MTTVRKHDPAASASAPFDISTGVRSADPYVKMFVYGDSGVGKTVLAATAADVPEMQDVLIINAEAGLKSISESGAVTNHADIVSWRVQDFATFVKAHAFLQAHCEARDRKDNARLEAIASRVGVDPSFRFRTVIIDSATEIESMNMQRILGSDLSDLMQDVPSAEFQDYGKNRNMMHKALRAFRNLPMHVIITCLRDWDQDEKKKYGYTPKLTGKLSKEVQAFMDIVGYLSMAIPEGSEGDTRRRLYLQPVGKFDAKSRVTPQDVAYIEDPSMNDIMSRLNKKRSAVQPPRKEGSAKKKVVD